MSAGKTFAIIAGMIVGIVLAMPWLLAGLFAYTNWVRHITGFAP
jgi:hypothetical protein